MKHTLIIHLPYLPRENSKGLTQANREKGQPEAVSVASSTRDIQLEYGEIMF